MGEEHGIGGLDSWVLASALAGWGLSRDSPLASFVLGGGGEGERDVRWVRRGLEMPCSGCGSGWEAGMPAWARVPVPLWVCGIKPTLPVSEDGFS